MSAFYAVKYHNRVELIVDGAVYDGDGILTDIRRKVWTSDCPSLSMTGRGNAAVVEAFAMAIKLISSFCTTFDDAVRAVQGMLDDRKAKGVPSDIEMVIVGVSETVGPQILYFLTRDVHDTGIEPWTLIDVGSELGGGNPLSDEDLAGIGSPAESLRGVAVPLFEAMRRKKGDNPAQPALPPHYGIGGHVDWTVVTAGGCDVERVHEWADVIGEKIDPFRGDLALVAEIEAKTHEIERLTAQRRAQQLRAQNN